MVTAESAIQGPSRKVDWQSGKALGAAEVILALLVCLPTVAWLCFSVATRPNVFLGSWRSSIAWILALAILNLADVGNAYGLRLTPDVPAAAAAAILMNPALAAMVVFLGSCDPREVRRQIPPLMALFNRSQLAVAAAIASIASHAIVGGQMSFATLCLQTLTAVAILVAINHLLLGTMACVITGATPREAFGAMRLGGTADFVATWAAWAVMTLMICAAYQIGGPWVVIASCLPVVLGRQVLVRSQQLARSEAESTARQATVRELAERTAEERRDERLRIAADLHDTVLPPLYRVSLLCSVVKEDLSGGNLMAVEEDVPPLRAACEEASNTLRQVIGDLRSSPLGLRGLADSVRGLARDMQARCQARILAVVGDTGKPSEVVQLAAYQVVKEALSNAVYHAKGSEIRVELSSDDEFLRMSVEDNGVGFDPQIAKQDHFGLAIMKERAEAVGGAAYVDTAPGDGTIVAARFPI